MCEIPLQKYGYAYPLYSSYPTKNLSLCGSALYSDDVVASAWENCFSVFVRVTNYCIVLYCIVCIYSDAIGGATPKFLGGPNLRPTTDVIQASMAYNSQQWDWGQTEILCDVCKIQ